ncbi:MAG: N-acetyl-D-Glu racemase DgcA [Pseudomonadota bacterium]
MSRRLTVRRQSWPIAGSFSISRGSKTSADTLIVEISEGSSFGRGECVPYARYGETLDSAEAAIAKAISLVADGADRSVLAASMPAGAARNAVDCALWDLEAKLAGRPAWQLAGLQPPTPVETAFTISLDTVEAMGRSAAKSADKPLLKLKLTGEGDVERVAAVRENAPNSRIVVDANEAWTESQLNAFVPALAALGVEMIEQPLPAGADDALAGYDGPITLCADESCHGRESLGTLAGKYGMVNIKLDKTGGLTEALALRAAARSAGFEVMIGCMLASSLAMAPAVLLAQDAEIVDLDGPLWLAEDYEPPLAIDGATILPPDAGLWG